MPRVHKVKRAQKAYPSYGIDKGDSYYKSKRMSKTPPRRAQLTQSGFLSQLYDLEDNLSTEPTFEDVEMLIDELTDMASECQDSLDNMPEQLQDTSSSGELLLERISNLEEWVNALQELANNDEEQLTPEGLYDAINECNPGIA